MISLSFTVPGEPVAKARARITANGSFTPDKSVKFEKRVRRTAEAHLHGLGAGGQFPAEGPVSGVIYCYFGVPKSWPKWKQEAAIAEDMPHLTKPDEDNVNKAVKDALNGLIYKDDAQVVDFRVVKRYAAEPATVIDLSVEPSAPPAKRGEFASWLIATALR